MKDGKIFINSDVILDVLLEREPFVYFSQHLLALVETHLFEGYTSALILANCHYIVSSKKNKSVADICLQYLRSFLKVLPFTDRELAESLSSGFKDFEDGVQYYIALNNGISAVVTRNAVDYSRASGVNVISPKELILGMEE
jgi:predicted nucleic acid-binding protein